MEGWGAKEMGQKHRPGIGRFTPILGVSPQDGGGAGGVEWEGGSGIEDLGTKYSWNLTCRIQSFIYLAFIKYLLRAYFTKQWRHKDRH